jgi:MFS family permease
MQRNSPGEERSIGVPEASPIGSWSRGRAARLAVMSLVSVLMIAGLVASSLANGFGPDDPIFLISAAVLLTISWILIVRVPENRVSWTMLAVTVGLMGLVYASFVGEYWENFVSGIMLFGVILPGLGVFVPIWFPTGQPPSRRWRWVGWVALFGVSAIVAGQFVAVLIEDRPTDGITYCESVGTCSGIVGVAALLFAVGAAVISQAVRWRRARGVEKLQLRWLLPSFLIMGIGAFAEFGGFQGSAVALLFPLGFILIPVAIAVAITRYRLYDIDRIVSRSVSYVVVVGVLAGVYVGLVALLQVFVPSDNPVVVAASTLAVAALFNPLRKRVQGWVDRRFNRSRYDAERVMDSFVVSLRDRVEVDDVVDGWVGVVSETMQPSAVGVWIRRRS